MSARSILKLFGSAQAPDTSATEVTAFHPSLFTNLKSATAPLTVLQSKEARIVGYARRSSKKEESDSIDRQRRVLEEYAQRRFGRALDEFYSDASVSGRTANRPGYKRLLEDARTGRITHVVVEDIDRIARSLRIAAEFKEHCDTYEVTIHSVYKGGEVENSDVAIRGFMSADQVTTMRKRSMEGTRKKARMGLVVGAMPFGYVRASSAKGDWKVDESKRKLIEAIYDARIDGMECSLIARILNAREITQRSGHGLWVAKTVKDLLCNTKYMGVQVYGVVSQQLDRELGKTVAQDSRPENLIIADAPQLAIVDKAKWHAAFQSLQAPTRQTLKRPHTLLNSEHTLCANCGAKMRNGRTRRTDAWELRCKASDCRERAGHRVNSVEEQLIGAVKQVLDDPRYEAAFEAQLEVEHDRICRELADRRKALQNRIQALDTDIEELIDLAVDLTKRRKLDSVESRDELHSFESDRLTRRVSKAEAELRAAREEYTMLPRAPQKLDPAKRSRLVEALDRAMSARGSTEPRSAMEDEFLMQAEAAIGNLVEYVKIGTVFPGRAARYEFVIRLEPIFGDAIKSIGGERRTIVTVVHPQVPSLAHRGYIGEEASIAYTNRLLAATDEQFAVVEPAISQRVRKKLRRISWTTRQFVDLVFMMTRASVRADFLRFVTDPHTARVVSFLVTSSMASRDGTWMRMFAILRKSFPQLHAEMNPDAFPALHAYKQQCEANLRGKRQAACEEPKRAA